MRTMGAILLGVLIAVVIEAASWLIYGHWASISPYIPEMGDVGAILITGVIAAIVAVWGIYSQREITRRQVTFEYLSGLESDGDIINAWKLFKTSVKNGIGQYAAEEKDGSDETQAINTTLNTFELISIGIQLGIVDFALYSRWYRTGAIRAWTEAKPYIEAVRHRRNNSVIYHEFQELVRWLDTNQPPKRSWVWGRWF